MHHLKDSIENYLETIYLLHQEGPYVRSVDVAKRLKVSRPSVSNAVKRLVQEDYLIVNPDGGLKLTPKGEQLGVQTYRKHQMLKAWLLSVGVSEELAEEDACRIEHALSDESYEKLEEHWRKQKAEN